VCSGADPVETRPRCRSALPCWPVPASLWRIVQRRSREGRASVRRGHHEVVPAEQISAASSPGWSWDPTLYAGAARYYTMGRVANPASAAGALVATSTPHPRPRCLRDHTGSCLALSDHQLQ